MYAEYREQRNSEVLHLTGIGNGTEQSAIYYVQ